MKENATTSIAKTNQNPQEKLNFAQRTTPSSLSLSRLAFAGTFFFIRSSVKLGIIVLWVIMDGKCVIGLRTEM